MTVHKILSAVAIFLLMGVSAAIFAPAGALAGIVRLVFSDRLVLSNSKGSFWHGNAEVWVQSREGWQSLVRARWQWHWQAMIAGKIAWSVETSPMNDDEQKGLNTVSMSAQGVDWSLNRLPLPLSVFADHLPTDVRSAWVNFNPGGRLWVEKSAGRFLWSGVAQNASAQFYWQSASLSIIPVAPMGHYRIELTPANAQSWNMNIRTESGALQIAGNAQLSQTQLQGKITLSSAPEYRAQLTPILQFWGKPIGGDQFEILLNNFGR